MRHMLQDKFQIGANASAAAGPVGRHASAGTDWKVETQMLTYSRAKGLFAGIDLGGSWIERDKDATAAFYGRDHTNAEVLEGKVSTPPAARGFLDEVARVKTESDAR
jgi:SH3 domain-containing YSC84-like protein 1